MNDKIEGIVLRSRDYREHDAILTVLTRQGRIEFVARGLRKLTSKNAASAQLFQRSLFYYNETQRGLQSLKMCEMQEGFRHIREDLLLSAICEVMCEVMVKTDMEEADAMYELLLASMRRVEQNTQPLAMLGLFMALMLHQNGIEAYVEGCVHCHRQNHICALSLRDGGFICEACYRPQFHIHKNKRELKVFRMLMKARLEHIDLIEESAEITWSDIEVIIDMFLEYSGMTLTSVSFLKTVISM